MIPFAFPIFSDNRNQLTPQCKRANRFALVLFTVTALVGLAIKYVPS